MKQAYKISGLASAFVILLLLIPSLWPSDLALGASPRIAGAANAQVGEISNAARQRLEKFRDAMAVHKRNVRRLMEISGVVASGVGRAPDGEPVVRVFTERPSVRGIPEILEGVRVRTKVSGRFYARRGQTCDVEEDELEDGICQTWERWPLPVPIGVSVGHPAISAGTLGARVTDGTDVYILSNNHVLANINQATYEDPILQPGSYDGGVNTADAIANLTDFEPIKFCTVIWIWYICDQTNTIDAAIAQSTRGEVGVSTPMGEYSSLEGYGTPSPNLHEAYGDPNIIGDENLDLLLGEDVQKVGRTTGLTPGTVDAIHTTVDVCYDLSCTQIARFEDQLIIIPGTFSAGGDSGSLIVDDRQRPVGLLFAGSDTSTIANRIDLVLKRFGVTIDGETGPLPEPPNPPIGLAAEARSSSQIDLAWTDGSDNETEFGIERCTSPGCIDFGPIATVGANVTSYSDTGLSASTTYTYRVRAYNSGGSSDYSNTASAETDAEPALPPAAPSNLTATAVSSSRIDLAWTDNSDNAEGFVIERCKSSRRNKFTEIATVPAGTNTYSDTGLRRRTTYKYRVRAFNSAGYSKYSNEVEATTTSFR